MWDIASESRIFKTSSNFNFIIWMLIILLLIIIIILLFGIGIKSELPWFILTIKGLFILFWFENVWTERGNKITVTLWWLFQLNMIRLCMLNSILIGFRITLSLNSRTRLYWKRFLNYYIAIFTLFFLIEFLFFFNLYHIILWNSIVIYLIFMIINACGKIIKLTLAILSIDCLWLFLDIRSLS